MSAAHRGAHRFVAALMLLVLGWPARAGIDVDSINGSSSPPFLVWGTDRAGWVYVPARSLLLDGIESTFRNVGAASQTGPILRREVTVTVQERDRDGAVLARGVFPADASAGNLGAAMSPVLLVAGRPYFISYSGLLNLGLNIVDWNITAPTPQQPAGTVNLDGWYSGERFETYHPQVIDGVLQVFSAPILRFKGTPVAFDATAADCLFRWAEARFPTLLAPAGAPSGSYQGFYYRHYSASRSYAGVSAADGNVYFIGPDGALQNLGPASVWLVQAGCAV